MARKAKAAAEHTLHVVRHSAKSWSAEVHVDGKKVGDVDATTEKKLHSNAADLVGGKTA